MYLRLGVAVYDDGKIFDANNLVSVKQEEVNFSSFHP